MDLEDLRPDAVVGRVAIPLFNCNGLQKYILKNADLSGIGKQNKASLLNAVPKNKVYCKYIIKSLWISVLQTWQQQFPL